MYNKYQNYQTLSQKVKTEHNDSLTKRNDSNTVKIIFLNKQATSSPFGSNSTMDNAFQEDTLMNQLCFSLRQ